MAKLMTALRKLGPKLAHGGAMALEALAAWTAKRGGLLAEQAARMLKAARATLALGCRGCHGGAAMRLTGVGRVAPTMDRAGQPWARIVPPRALGRALGRRGACRDRLLNRSTTGLRDAALKLPWYAERPQDPLGSPLHWAT